MLLSESESCVTEVWVKYLSGVACFREQRGYIEVR